MKYKIFAATCLVLIGIFWATSYYYKVQQARMYDFMAQNNSSTFVRDHSMTLGSDDAKVYLVEFMDPACETCAAFSPYVKQMMKNNPGKTIGVIGGVAVGVATGGVGLAAMGTAIGTSTTGTTLITGTAGALAGDAVDNRINK